MMGAEKKRAKLSDAEHDRIAELRGEHGWSHIRIARCLKCSPGAVAWWCLIAGIEKPGPVPPPAEPYGPMVVRRGAFEVRRFTAEEDARIIALEADGATNSLIGRQLGRRANSIKGRLATLARRDERAAMRAEAAHG